MSTVDEEIVRLLDGDAVIAARVRDRMGFTGLDFSECTQREFTAAVGRAFADLCDDPDGAVEREHRGHLEIYARVCRILHPDAEKAARSD